MDGFTGFGICGSLTSDTIVTEYQSTGVAGSSFTRNSAPCKHGTGNFGHIGVDANGSSNQTETE